MQYLYFKRIADLLFALLMGIVLAPLVGVAALGILLTDRQSPFFIQIRPGQQGKLFACYKLRTMRNGSVTRLGKVLRMCALDEVPQLWNVLRSEMSLVGPRPLLAEYLEVYTTEQGLRHQVKPGLTGLAQLRKHQHPSWEERFELDVQYTRHQGFWLDLDILVKTLPVLFHSIRNAHYIPDSKFQGAHE